MQGNIFPPAAVGGSSRRLQQQDEDEAALFVPQPQFLLQTTGLPPTHCKQQRPSKNEFSFTFTNSMLDYDAPAQANQPHLIELEVRALKDPVDVHLSAEIKASLFGYRRTKACEVLLSESVFRKYGLSQPVCILIEASLHSHQHSAVAYIDTRVRETQPADDGDKEEFTSDVTECIWLPPMLEQKFPSGTQVRIRAHRAAERAARDSSDTHLNSINAVQSGLYPDLLHLSLELLGGTGGGARPEEPLAIKSALLQKFAEHPEIVQVGDLLPLKISPLSSSLCFARVVALKYRRDTAYMLKVLDIEDPQVGAATLAEEVEVSELTFNHHPGYLASTLLADVELVQRETAGASWLPRFALRSQGLLATLTSTESFCQPVARLTSLITESNEPPICMLAGASGCGKSHMLRYVADRLGMHFVSFDALKHLNLTKLSDLFGRQIGAAPQPLLVELTNFHRFNLFLESGAAATSKQNRDLAEMRFCQVFNRCIAQLADISAGEGGQTYVVVTCSKLEEMGSLTKLCFANRVRVPALSRDDRIKVLKYLRANTGDSLEPEYHAEVSKYVQGKSFREIKKLLQKIELEKGPKLTQKEMIDQLNKIDKERKVFGEQSVKIPEVKWADVGGLAGAKEDILQTIMLPIEKPHLFKNGVTQRSGLLFYGPPGTGKTLLAKAIATECQMNFISVKGPELLNMYVGESEKNVREVFERARENLPCIVFFDELDSLAPARGKGADSSQVMDRIVAQLLTEIDGVGKKPGMFTIGATNRPDLLDSALLRTGRFDKMIYLGVAATVQEKVKIIQAQTRNMRVQPEIDLNKIAERLPPNFTGADFSALTSESYMIAVKQRIEQVEAEIEQFKQTSGMSADDELLPETYFKLRYPDDVDKQKDAVQVEVRFEHFEQALHQVTPSISPDELHRYEDLRKKYSASEDNNDNNK